MLNLVRDTLGLVWAPDQGIIHVTTAEEVEQRYLGEIKYDVTDLLLAVKGDVESLTDLIKTTVCPSSWDAGSIMLLTPASWQVKQTYQVHRAIERLLSELRQAGRGK